MTANIKLHAAHGHFLHIQISIYNFLPIPHRFCLVMTIRINDAASAAAYGFRQLRNFVRTMQIVRIHCFRKNHVAIDKIAMPFNGNVANGGLPFLIVIRIGRDIKGNALFVQGDACQRHVALPADQAPHSAPRGYPPPGSIPYPHRPKPHVPRR